MGQRGPTPGTKALQGDDTRWWSTITTVPPMPSWLPECRRKVWKEVGEYLIGHRLLCSGDRLALAMVLDAFDEYRRLTDQIDWSDLAQEDKHGKRSANPLLKPRAAAWDRVVRGLRHFGMTPDARPNVKGETEKDGDDSDLRILGIG